MINHLTHLGDLHEIPRIEWIVTAAPDGPNVQGTVPSNYGNEAGREVAQAWADLLSLREATSKNAAAVHVGQHSGITYIVRAL